MSIEVILITYLTLHIVLIIFGQVSPNSRLTNIFGFFLFFCLPIYYIREFNGNNAIWEILLVLIIIRLLLLGGYDLYIAINEPVNSYSVIIDLFGIFSGFLYLRLENSLRLLPFLISFIFLLYMTFQGRDYWIFYHNYGSFTGKITPYKMSHKIEGIDQNNTNITNQLFGNKIVLLDFWIITCGLCFKKFPQVQEAYNKYENDPSVAIFAINKPIEEYTPTQIFDFLKHEGYSFPIVIPTDTELPEKFGVTGYPTTFVINRNSQIVYKGDIEGAVKMIDELKSNSQ